MQQSLDQPIHLERSRHESAPATEKASSVAAGDTETTLSDVDISLMNLDAEIITLKERLRILGIRDPNTKLDGKQLDMPLFLLNVKPMVTALILASLWCFLALMIKAEFRGDSLLFDVFLGTGFIAAASYYFCWIAQRAVEAKDAKAVLDSAIRVHDHLSYRLEVIRAQQNGGKPLQSKKETVPKASANE